MIKRALLYFPIFLLSSFCGKTQFTENFSDGDFLSNPTWIGTSSDWIINNNLQLQSNNTLANSSFGISTASTLATIAQWEFFVALNFATSGLNYADVYLMSSHSDLMSVAASGYFVRIGNTSDEISLYRKDAGVSSVVKIIDGTDGVMNSTTNNQVKIKVTRDDANKWTLYRDQTGTGNNYFKEGITTDATFNATSFFGILIRQSTTGFFQRHFFDDIEVKPFAPDITSPVIISVIPISANAVDVLFNEQVENTSSQKSINYVVDNLIGAAVTAIQDANNAALIHLTFPGSFTNALSYQLTVTDVKDLAGNTIVNSKTNFIYYAPYTARQYDVVIDEIMADPTPPVGLPNSEWIELKNTSANAINLKDWKIGDMSGQSGPMPNFLLKPDSFVIISSAASLTNLAAFGSVITVTGFPSLDNNNDQLFIKSSENSIIHTVNYSDKWYQNELKKEGGWSLEMIDTKNPCSGISNWKASTDVRGGSPGKKNANDAINVDKNAPKLLRAYAADSLNIILVFDEPLDSLNSVTVSNFTINNGLSVVAATTISPFFNNVNLKLNAPLLRNKIYTITAVGITDCVGNVIDYKNISRAGLSEVASISDIIINEVLFNPLPAGTDYVEIYNRSNKIIDLKQTYIANRSTTGVISNIIQLSPVSYLLFPLDFIVITENAAMVKAGYIAQNIDAFTEVTAMPSYNDDKGTIVILNAQGAITDELSYNEKWHFNLISNPDGVALERIDYNSPTQLQDNWHSAATSAGYGTPTYKNSQYRINDGVQGEIKLMPEIVSPDNDGQDDFASIDYNFPEPGYVANITIFNASGRPIRYLQRNALCGTKGNFQWDGLGEKGQPLPIGIYIVYTEVFNLKGNKKQFKNAIVLARRN